MRSRISATARRARAAQAPQGAVRDRRRHRDQGRLRPGRCTRRPPTPPGRVPVHARRPADDVPRPAVDDAPVRRVRHRRRVEPPLQVPARAGRQGPVGRVRSADADGPRLGSPDGARRGRPGRRRDRLARGHARAVRRHPARRRLDVDDDQRDRGDAARALHRGRRGARRAARATLRGTIQNDILKEYIARGTYIYPPAGSMRLITDTFTYCSREVPQWNTVSISGYHIREAGSDAVQEVAFTLADGIAYVEAALAAGLDVDEFAPRLSFFFNVHNNFLEEVAKFRAARAHVGARSCATGSARRTAKSQMLRFHTPDRGRDAAGAAAARQRRARDAAGARRGARRHAVAAHEQLRRGARPADRGGRADRAAHAAGDRPRVRRRRLHRSARRLVGGRGADRRDRAARAARTSPKIDELGGMVRAIEQGFPQREIERRAYEHQRAVEAQASGSSSASTSS